MRVAVRADASVEIGLGHVKRCLALMHALRTLGAELCLVVRRLDVDIASITTAETINTLYLPTPNEAYWPSPGEPFYAGWARVPAPRDAAETTAILQDWKPDWVIVDHYAFDEGWQHTIRSSLGCRVAAIDDLADRLHAVDVLVDHTYDPDHRRKYGIYAAGVPTLLGGPHFALLGPAYADSPRNPARAEVVSVGIFMGGVDAPNFSLVALRTLREQLHFVGAVEIATTSANPNLASLVNYATETTQVRLSIDLPNLAGFFARHELHIGAGGGATWERCCIGAPTLALVSAANQRSVLAPLAGLDILQIANIELMTPEDLAQPLQNMINDAGLRARLAANARQLVDGRGSLRVAQALRDHV